MAERAAIAALHASCRASGRRFWLSAAGGGAGLHSALLRVPGASSTVLACHVPYASHELEEFVGPGTISGSQCSREAAANMAEASRARAAQGLLGLWAAGEAARPGLATGVGLTASLATTREHRGELRAFGSVVDLERTWELRVRLSKTDASTSTRDAQEEIVSLLMLWMIGRFVGLDASLTEGVAGRAAELGFPPLAGATAADGELACIARDGDDDGGNAAWLTGGPTRSGLASLADDRPCLVMPGPGPLGASFVLPGAVPPPGSVVLSGSFNPLHGGHEALLAAASAAARREDAALAGVDPASLPLPSRVLELSATNADKGSLDPAALAARAELCAGPLPDAELAGLGLAGHPDSLRELYPADATGSSGELLPLLVTTLPFFPDKAERLGRGSWLVVGVDTAVRLCDDKYFGGAPSGVTRALARIEASGCRVLVAGRPADAKAGEGRFVTLDDVIDSVPEAFAVRRTDGSVRCAAGSDDPTSPRPLFVGMPEAAFASAASSSRVRAASQGTG